MPGRVPYLRCPLCEAIDLRQERVADCTWHALHSPLLGDSIRWLRCAACGHVFCDGYFSPEQFAELLSRTAEGQTPGENAAAARETAGRMIARVSSMRAAPAHWLDVGFGNGALLTTAAEFGYSVCGLDLRKDNVEKLRALGFEAHCKELSEFDPPRPPDVISFCDVLEHMPFPKLALQRAHQIAAQGAVILVSMPNLDSFIWQHLERENANPYWGEIEHLHNFGRARVYSLLEETGFQPCGYAVSERYIACMEVIARRI